jgi:hypothetical protein
VSSILFVITGASSWTLADGSDHPTGFWAEEVLTPYRLLAEGGHEIVFATPGGVAPVPDAASLGEWDADAIAELSGLSTPAALSDIAAASFRVTPRHQIGLGSGSTATFSITVARMSRSRRATGCHRGGQHTCRESGERPEHRLFRMASPIMPYRLGHIDAVKSAR